MWFADLSKQSRLHCQNFLSIWTTITLLRIKAAHISIYIHKASTHAAEIWDRGWNIHASCFGVAGGWNGCSTLTLYSGRGWLYTYLETLNASNIFPYKLVNNNLRDWTVHFSLSAFICCIVVLQHCIWQTFQESQTQIEVPLNHLKQLKNTIREATQLHGMWWISRNRIVSWRLLCKIQV